MRCPIKVKNFKMGEYGLSSPMTRSPTSQSAAAGFEHFSSGKSFMTEPIYKCLTKVTNKAAGTPSHSFNWVISRRGWFKIFTDRIECGNWKIPFAEVQEMLVYRGKQMLIPVTVLQIETSGETYQFGFNPWANPIKYLSVPYREERVRIKYSVFSIAVRVIIVCYLIYLIWLKFG